MNNLFNYSEMLAAIEFDLDYQQFPDKFSMQQVLMGEQWLRAELLVTSAQSLSTT